MRSSLLILIVGACVWRCGLSRAEEDQLARVRKLVENLASKNSRPEGELKENVPIERFSKDYKPEAQAVVYKAIEQLLQEGSGAFDVLVEHFNDRRYSYTSASPSGDYNRSVGTVCQIVVDRCIRCYVNEIPLISRDQWEEGCLWKDEKLEDWWKRNRDRPLPEIQVEAIGAQMSAIESLKYESARPSHPKAEKLKREEFERLQKESLKTLSAMRTEIQTSNVPHVPKSIDSTYDVFTKLPWPTRRFGK
jgi:hypothetical protein